MNKAILITFAVAVGFIASFCTGACFAHVHMLISISRMFWEGVVGYIALLMLAGLTSVMFWTWI